MVILTVGILKNLMENMPNDFTVEYDNKKTISPINDKVEIDITGEKLILK